VGETVIAEQKFVRWVVRAHETQPVNYLVATKIDVGLVLNFGKLEAEGKRKMNSLS
jgi:GxxExxY protein